MRKYSSVITLRLIRIGCLAALAGWLAGPWGSAEEPFAGKVGPVSVEVQNGHLQVKLPRTNDALKGETARLLRPNRLVIEFDKAKLNGGPQIIKIGQGGLKQISSRQEKMKTVVILELIDKADWPSVTSEESANAYQLTVKADLPFKPIAGAPPAVAIVKPPVNGTKPPEEPKPPKIGITKPPANGHEPPVVAVNPPDEHPPKEIPPKPDPPKNGNGKSGTGEPDIKIIKVVDPKPVVEETLATGKEDPDPPATDVTTPKPIVRGDWNQRVDLHLQNADLLATLINIVDELGYNLVPSKSVSGTVTIRLTQVPLSKALEHILNQANLTYVKEDNVIRVATSTELQAEEDQGRLITKVFPLNYGSASTMSTSIKTVLSGRGKVELDARVNALIITDTPIKLKAAEAMIKLLDARTRQVEIEAAIVAFRKGKSKEIGIQWEGKQGSIAGRTPAGTGKPDVNVTINPPTTTATGFGSIAIGTITNGVTIGALLSMLERDEDADILARPHVTTLNNKTANINITTDFPYTSAFNQQTGIATFSTVTTGIILNVTPLINEDGFVTLKVKPSVSSVIATGPPPVIDKREAETEVLIKDGGTLVIGGLLREDEIVTTTKIPFFAELPIVGGIFRSTSSTKTKNELMILIKTTIIPIQ